MKQTVENNQIVFRCLDKAVRYSLLFIQNHISELESELVKFREYERLLTTACTGLVGRPAPELPPSAPPLNSIVNKT